MKGLPCPSLCLPHVWQLGSCFMADGSGTQALGKGPPLRIQLLRAQYEGLRQQQRAQTHIVVLPKGGNTPAPAESMVSPVWINKERRHSLFLDQVDPEEAGMWEEVDRGYPQVLGALWRTHLQMHCSVQAFHQETSHHIKHKGEFTGSEQRVPQQRDPGLLENEQVTQQETTMPEAAPLDQCQVGKTQMQAVAPGLNNGIRGPSSIKNPHRSGKAAHYPFPQRKTPRISQAARNLGLYGPA
uniref:TBC1 domain-containing protein n=1 Tax=Desmodus rotundus TaxID=9430 RepID=K9IH07_DESRO